MMVDWCLQPVCHSSTARLELMRICEIALRDPLCFLQWVISPCDKKFPLLVTTPAVLCAIAIFVPLCRQVQLQVPHQVQVHLQDNSILIHARVSRARCETRDALTNPRVAVTRMLALLILRMIRNGPTNRLCNLRGRLRSRKYLVLSSTASPTCVGPAARQCWSAFLCICSCALRNCPNAVLKSSCNLLVKLDTASLVVSELEWNNCNGCSGWYP